MKNGIDRFDYYLNQLEKLFLEAANQTDAAFWLYKNNARTPFFMLEGLARITGGLHDKKLFSELKDSFKLIEDAIGAIDYYDNFAEEFSANKNIPDFVTNYAKEKSLESTAKLHALLVENKWLGENAAMINSIRRKLNTADWLKIKDEADAIETYYKKQIDEINEFYKLSNGNFTEIETQVHSMRRKLRWLSIYPQCLRGIIQLFERQNNDLQNYLTPEIVNSPFNKMPDAAENKFLFMLNKPNFLALSWMISELGKLKDQGLRITLICETLQHTKDLSQNEALAETYKMLAPETTTLDGILRTASEICGEFFAKQVPDNLIYGILKVKKD